MNTVTVVMISRSSTAKNMFLITFRVFIAQHLFEKMYLNYSIKKAVLSINAGKDDSSGVFLTSCEKNMEFFEKNSEKHLIFAKNRVIILYDDSKPKDRNPSGL